MVKEIFRNYDIRGIYGQTLTDGDAFLIGKAFGSVMTERGAKQCAVGYDNRLSSPVLSAKYREGILSTGMDVLDLGECLTPFVKFYVYEKGLGAGTSVTASHNAAEYNGFKLIIENGGAFYGEEITRLYDIIQKGEFVSGSGKLIAATDLYSLYLGFLKNRFDFSKRKLKVALNCGNGTAGIFAPRIFRELGVEVVEVNCLSDGSFPNGAPDPERKDFMQVLESRVIENKCDLGIGLDGDSDRFGLVDETGTHYESDKLMMLLARYFLKQHAGGLISCDIKSSSALVNKVKEWGGQSVMVKTGYPYHIPQAQGDALFSAEFSGHFFMGKKLGFYGLDDAIITSCIMLKVYSESGREKFSQLMETLPRLYHTSEIKIDCPDKIKMDIIDKIVRESKNRGDIQEILTIDGVRGNVSPTGWFLLRASNTSPYVVARLEGKDEEEVKKLKELVAGLLSGNGLSGEVVTGAPVYHS